MKFIKDTSSNSKKSCKINESDSDTASKTITNAVLESAAKERLYNSLGYDEGRIYFSLLSKTSEQVQKEFSYSKRYRVLKKLYKLGAVAKCRIQNKENSTYFVLPPSCILKNESNDKISQFLDELYYSNFKEQWKGFIEISVSKDEQLILALLKQFTDKTSEIIADRSLIKQVRNNIPDNEISVKESYESRKNAGRIDNKIFFEFTKPFEDFSEESSGYIAFTESMLLPEMIVKVKNRIQKILYN